MQTELAQFHTQKLEKSRETCAHGKRIKVKFVYKVGTVTLLKIHQFGKYVFFNRISIIMLSDVAEKLPGKML